MTHEPDQSEVQMERRLDALGERERGVPDAGFEARVAAVAARAARKAPGPRALGGAGVFGRQGWLRLAAVIAVMGGVGAGALLLRSGGVGVNGPAGGEVASAGELGSELDAWMEELAGAEALTNSTAGEMTELAGWGELEIDFWGESDPLFGTIESF